MTNNAHNLMMLAERIRLQGVYAKGHLAEKRATFKLKTVRALLDQALEGLANDDPRRVARALQIAANGITEAADDLELWAEGVAYREAYGEDIWAFERSGDSGTDID